MRQDSTLRLLHCREPQRWDEAVQCLGGHLLQGWNWGAFKGRHGWRAERLLLSAGERPVAAAQVLFRRLGPFSAGYVPRGPLVADPDHRVLASLTLGLDRVARRERALLTLIEPENSQLDWSTLGQLGWRDSRAIIQPRRTIKLSLDASDEQLLAAMKPKTRYNIRLAARRGVTVRQGDASDLPAFYSLLRETGERQSFGIHDYAYFADLLGTFGERGALLLGEYEGQLAAGALVVRAFGEGIYLYGASNTELQKHMAAHLVQFEAMRWSRDAGCQRYDLWGIPSEEDLPKVDEGQIGRDVRGAMLGVYTFKQGFGGEVVSYPRMLERIYAGPLVRLARRLGWGAW
ncbi:MAG TPA: peptidoglycan bridge formation glycyltransferase FemA/FemB family protein [Thermomicrobiaceae bacterium]|nr:peptidoglycan bridge formation glycyltransferase FemA/FemB family protein [Thermomicrobiaceae bacterium]